MDATRGTARRSEDACAHVPGLGARGADIEHDERKNTRAEEQRPRHEAYRRNKLARALRGGLGQLLRTLDRHNTAKDNAEHRRTQQCRTYALECEARPRRHEAGTEIAEAERPRSRAYGSTKHKSHERC